MSLICPQCQSSHTRKAGISRHGHQRWLCKGCGRTFGEKNYRLIDPATREKALAMYAEGIAARAIERLLGVSHNSVLGWVRQEVAGRALQRVDAADIEFIEADELWSYVGSKKHHFGSGGLLIGLPRQYSDGRWAIVTPEQPERFARKFLAALTSPTAPTTGSATTPSSQPSSTSGARPRRTSSRA